MDQPNSPTREGSHRICKACLRHPYYRPPPLPSEHTPCSRTYLNRILMETMELLGGFARGASGLGGLKWVNARTQASLQKEPWIRSNPAEAVKHWQQLYEQRVRRSINQDLCIMTESLGGLLHQLACGRQFSETSTELLIDRDASDPKDLALVSALLEAGLREVCAKVISADDFALERFVSYHHCRCTECSQCISS